MWKKIVDTPIPETAKVIVILGKQTKKQSSITHQLIVQAYEPKPKVKKEIP
jgi:hypothetical protein